MDVGMMRRIDRLLGVPLCLLLTLHRRLAGRRRESDGGPARSILFVKLAEQGSTVLAHEAVRRAVEAAGRENVHFLVFAENRFILEAMGLIPAANIHAISSRSLPEMARTALGALRRLRRLNLDAAVDLEFFSRATAVLAYLSGAGILSGFHPGAGGPYRGDLLTQRVLFNPRLHTADGFLSLVEALFRPAASFPAFDWRPPADRAPLPSFTPSPAEREEVAALLREAAGGRPASPLVLLNPNTGDLLPLRRWPAERFVHLARLLLERHPGALVVFTGSPEESRGTDLLAGRVGSGRCISLAGKTDLRRLLTLYTLADLLVTNDSGPAHFAALTPVETVVLFGPETPALFAARTGRCRVLWAGLACSPCLSAYNGRTSSCTDNRCLQAITVEEVLREAESALAR